MFDAIRDADVDEIRVLPIAVLLSVKCSASFEMSTPASLQYLTASRQSALVAGLAGCQSGGSLKKTWRVSNGQHGGVDTHTRRKRWGRALPIHEQPHGNGRGVDQPDAPLLAEVDEARGGERGVGEAIMAVGERGVHDSRPSLGDEFLNTQCKSAIMSVQL